ncbi:unnamed protein product, partial [Brassica oleracea]
EECGRTRLRGNLLWCFDCKVAELPLVAIRMCGYKCDGS